MWVVACAPLYKLSGVYTQAHAWASTRMQPPVYLKRHRGLPWGQRLLFESPITEVRLGPLGTHSSPGTATVPQVQSQFSLSRAPSPPGIAPAPQEHPQPRVPATFPGQGGTPSPDPEPTRAAVSLSRVLQERCPPRTQPRDTGMTRRVGVSRWEGMGVTQNPCRGPVVWQVHPCLLATGDGGRLMNNKGCVRVWGGCL